MKKYPLIFIPILCIVLQLGCVFTVIGMYRSPRPVSTVGVYDPDAPQTEDDKTSLELNYEYNTRITNTLVTVAAVLIVTAVIELIYVFYVRRRNKPEENNPQELLYPEKRG